MGALRVIENACAKKGELPRTKHKGTIWVTSWAQRADKGEREP